MRIYDTAQRSVVELELGDHVGMYVCGITPYDATHLGHAATYMAYDLLIRRLEDMGHTVTLVRNYTDVDDSILPKAAELGEHYLSLAEREIERFEADMEALGARPAAHEPRATRSIDAMITMITKLIDAGHAYASADRVFFDVATFPDFGKLSGYSADRMTELAAERGGTPDDPRQRNPLDFVLWQASADGEPSWPSPFGPGRPGWHIECSAMGYAALGETIDIHGGGGDLVFPHHECEIAQSESVHRVPLARYWVHAGLVSYQGHKMSKSLGNLVFISDLRARVDPRAIRLALMAHHYRTEWEWFDSEGLTAQRDLDTLVGAASGASPAAGSGAGSPGLLAEVQAVLDDDLNAPMARTALLDAAAAVERGAGGATLRGELAAAAALCGIDLSLPPATAAP
ncbi:cysteine--tRNA ligase [Candidatus Poriferisodalis sp.]|uniref:cysteine--tRNA ligase n=1 Tax=Candidatus Poriferisodalis sp. TaxID=3101277 RepID=UPI003B015B2B